MVVDDATSTASQPLARRRHVLHHPRYAPPGPLHSADTAPPAASAPAPSPQQHLTESQARRPLLLRLLSSAGLRLRVSLPLQLLALRCCSPPRCGCWACSARCCVRRAATPFEDATPAEDFVVILASQDMNEEAASLLTCAAYTRFEHGHRRGTRMRS